MRFVSNGDAPCRFEVRCLNQLVVVEIRHLVGCCDACESFVSPQLQTSFYKSSNRQWHKLLNETFLPSSEPALFLQEII